MHKQLIDCQAHIVIMYVNIYMYHLLYCILEGIQMVVSNESTNANVIVEAAGMMWQ